MKLKTESKDPFEPETIVEQIGATPNEINLWVTPIDRATAAYNDYENGILKILLTALVIMFIAVLL